MMQKSHRRLEEQLGLLCGADAPEHVAAVSAFFQRSVIRHEKDEEASLFPRLTAHASLVPIVRQLVAEHHALAKLHDQLHRMAATDTPCTADIQALGALLTDGYTRHIALEETQLFPLAKELLPAADCIAIAAEMQVRRGRSKEHLSK